MKNLIISILLFCATLSPVFAEDAKPTQEEQLKTELLQKTKNIFDFVESGVKSSTDFVKEQTPLLVKEILNYTMWLDIFWILFWWTIFGVLLCFSVRHYNKNIGHVERVTEENNLIMGFSIIFSGVVFIFSLISTAANGIELLKVLTAPRLFLLEYVRHLNLF